jgi:hypothetical protein
MGINIRKRLIIGADSGWNHGELSVGADGFGYVER